MSRIKLGGIKVFEKRAYRSWARRDTRSLGEICSRLAADRTNLGLVTHIAGLGNGECLSAASAMTAQSLARCVGRGDASSGTAADNVCRVSVFPHDQRPGVAALLIRSLAGGGIETHAFASSPSALTAVVSAGDFRGAMERILETFTFSAYDSYEGWHAIYREQEVPLQEVRCSYHEEMIHVYDFALSEGLDLWNLAVPPGNADVFGQALSEMEELRLKMPFLVSNRGPDGEEIFALCLASERREEIGRILEEKIPGRAAACLGPVTAIFLHGPHFGDRFGIADALVSALRGGGIELLALSCAVATISAVVRGGGRERIKEALSSRFSTPGR